MDSFSTFADYFQYFKVTSYRLLAAGNASAPTVVSAIGFYPFDYIRDGTIPTFSSLSVATIGDTKGGLLVTTGGSDIGQWVNWPDSTAFWACDQAISQNNGAFLFAYNATGSPYCNFTLQMKIKFYRKKLI